ncbi:hypothetical protein [Phaeobacter sp. J2-8]|uniref:hypothetical protein n=1 Tax=Phaeobacter sp. J2-8 TaxID=2931394 RepID=UPI001FCFD7CB|nr:hypothetical protein [Phaeobacter sp. J2-8]MCJ7875087.1 hypothetical protein [Phaeobacter sp. J2-8]
MGGYEQNQVRRRRVFYIPGYDPIHPRRYRELYRKEGAAQAGISGYDLTLTPRKSQENFGWNVVGDMDGATVTTEVEVLVWSDIVKNSMRHGIARTYLAMLQTAVTYIGTGAMWRLTKLRSGPVIAALYPVVMLLCQAVLALIATIVAYRVGNWAINAAILAGGGDLGGVARFVGPLVAGLLGLGVGWAILDRFRRWDSKLFVYYLMHDYSYSARTKGANTPEMEARIAAFTDAVAAACQEDVDEILVIGHSSGAHLAVSVMSDLIRSGRAVDGAGRAPGQGPALGLLTLGQVMPMVTFLPDAWRLRNDLAFLSQSDAVFWADVTAPGDGCAFALCDPVAVSGVAGPDQKAPLVFSAAFKKSLTAARLKELRWRFFRLHFQYLCAFDAPRDYDYFRITAGPLTLRQRYQTRVSSKSRVATPVNTFTSTAP